MHAVDTIRQRFTEEATRGIAESLCEAPAKLRHLAEIASGLLLAGLAEMSSRPQGARAIARALLEEDLLRLENLAEIMRGSQANVCMERGERQIVELLGGDFMECSGRVLNAYAGLGVGAAKSLVSLLMPVVLTAFQQSLTQTGSTDADAVSQAVEAQRSSISSLLPDDFSLAQSGEARLQRCGQCLEQPPEEDAVAKTAVLPPPADDAHPPFAFLSRMMPLVMIGLVTVAVTDRYIRYATT